uniref:Uncharacterized protein n=1 Tax=Oryza meridionalis TaxID=40149 RepID=A0A0E0DWH7_9ORYZ
MLPGPLLPTPPPLPPELVVYPSVPGLPPSATPPPSSSIGSSIAIVVLVIITTTIMIVSIVVIRCSYRRGLIHGSSSTPVVAGHTTLHIFTTFSAIAGSQSSGWSVSQAVDFAAVGEPLGAGAHGHVGNKRGNEVASWYVGLTSLSGFDPGFVSRGG